MSEARRRSVRGMNIRVLVVITHERCGMSRRAEVQDQRAPRRADRAAQRARKLNFERQTIMRSKRHANSHSAFAPILVLGVTACATTHEPPAELLQARSAYSAAQDSAAWRYDRTGLNDASLALAKAESSFEKEGDSKTTRKEAQEALVRAQQARIDGALNARPQAEEALIADDSETSSEQAPKATVALAVALFPTGQSRLPAEARDRLDQLVDEVKGSPDATVHIRGHADATGSERRNMELSRERADQVAEYVASQGIPRAQIMVDAVGDSEPLVSSQSADAINRRVQLVAYLPAQQEIP